MGLNKKQREKLLRENCGAINEDDAIDPRHYFFNKRKNRSKHRKVYQLCRQVFETLQLAINSIHRKLINVSVVEVLPAPDASRLLVIVSIDCVAAIESASEIEEIVAILNDNTPRMRTEIARAINRRKTPNLVFEIARLN